MADVRRFMKNGDYYYFGEAPKHLSGVTLDKSEITLSTVGQTDTLLATIVPTDPVEDVTLNWSSSDTSIATVAPYEPRLPTEYQEVEYIQSSGTQWIDTGVYGNQNTIVEAKWSLTQYNGNYDKMYGGYGANDSNVYFMQSNRPDNNKFRVVNYVNTSNRKYVDSTSDLVLGKIYETKHTNTEFYIDGTLQGTCATTTYTSGYTVSIFALHTGADTVIQNVYMKLYYFKMYDGATLVRDFVPCYRISDDVIGLYDLVNDTFYTNAGTGTFTKGSDINPDAIVTCVTPGEATITVTTTPGSYTATCDIDDWKWIPTSTTIGYWELNGNAEDTKNDYGVTTYTTTDYDSNGYTGAGLPTYTTGRKGKQCAYFAGDRCLNLPVLPIPSNTITVSLWAKLGSSSNGNLFSHRQDLSSSNSGWCIGMGTGTGGVIAVSWVGTTYSTGTSGQTGYGFTNFTVTTSERHHIVFTFSGGTAKLYIDGVLKETKSGRAWLRNSNSTQSFIGGSVNYSGQNYATGHIQDVIYDNRTRSDQDVADYYTNSL